MRSSTHHLRLCELGDMHVGVYLGIDACFSGAVQQVRDQGKRVTILLGDFVQTTEVNAETESAVLFLSKRTGRRTETVTV